jgi:hypothetical protein
MSLSGPQPRWFSKTPLFNGATRGGAFSTGAKGVRFRTALTRAVSGGSRTEYLSSLEAHGSRSSP